MRVRVMVRVEGACHTEPRAKTSDHAPCTMHQAGKAAIIQSTNHVTEASITSVAKASIRNCTESPYSPL